jgi:hypothetical protein
MRNHLLYNANCHLVAMSHRSLALVLLVIAVAALPLLTDATGSVDDTFDDDEFEFSGSSAAAQPRTSSYEEDADVASSSFTIEEDDYKPLAPPKAADHAPRSQFREMIREKLGETLESTGNHYRSMTSRLERMQASNDYGFEIICLGLLLVFGAVYFIGGRSNAAVADAWLASNSALLQEQFKQVGVMSGSDGSLELLSDSPACFVMHCSGRSCGVQSLRATINLKPRHDIFMSLANFFVESEDSVQASVKYTPRGDGGNTVYLLVMPQKLMASAKSLHPENSIGKFVKCDALSAAGLVLVADAPDYALSLLSKPVLQALIDCAPVLSYLKISDRRQEDASQGNDHRVAFETRLSHSSITQSECIDASELCLRVALRLADTMSTHFVSPVEKEQLAGMRRKLEEKQTADKRKEAEALAQQKKQEKLDKAWAQVGVAALLFAPVVVGLTPASQVKALKATDPKKAAKEEEKLLKKVLARALAAESTLFQINPLCFFLTRERAVPLLQRRCCHAFVALLRVLTVVSSHRSKRNALCF